MSSKGKLIINTALLCLFMHYLILLIPNLVGGPWTYNDTNLSGDDSQLERLYQMLYFQSISGSLFFKGVGLILTFPLVLIFSYVFGRKHKKNWMHIRPAIFIGGFIFILLAFLPVSPMLYAVVNNLSPRWLPLGITFILAQMHIQSISDYRITT